MREDSAAVPVGFGILLLVTLALYTFDPGLAKILAVFDTVVFIVVLWLATERKDEPSSCREASLPSQPDEEDDSSDDGAEN